MAATVEYIVADTNQAAAILAESYPHTSRNALQLDVIDPFALTLLASVLNVGGKRDAPPDVDGFLPVLQTAGSDGPWVLVVPSELTVAVSKMTDRDTAAIAEAWRAELSQWLGFEPTAADATEWLVLLRSRAQAAVLQKRPLLIFAMA